MLRTGAFAWTPYPIPSPEIYEIYVSPEIYEIYVPYPHPTCIAYSDPTPLLDLRYDSEERDKV